MTIMEFLSNWATWVLAMLIGMGGEITKSFILTKPFQKENGGYNGWRGVYFMTYKAHGVVVGTALGLLACSTHLHVAEGIESWADYALWGLGSGVIAMTCYAVMMGTLKSSLSQMGKRRD